MYFLYYDHSEKLLILTETIQNTRSLELLETNAVLEKLIVRSEMYKRQYRCELINNVDVKPNKRTIRKIQNIPGPRERKSDETRRRMSEARKGEGNSQWGVPNPPEIKARKSAKLKEHYKYHVHGKEGYRDSEETRRMKSVNNNNKGGWFWICNHFTKEERRCTGDVPTGWRRGRLRNYAQYIKHHKKT